jgi:predicted regulator of Ras-like GTPase activity (Roadblock/LC7/MglB family)
MKAPAQADLQRWSEEVARDPAALAFLPLARAFRKQGRRDAALKLCLRGLEHHPTHVEAHALQSGQRSKAYDEWSMVLRLEPDNFEALRGMGFYHLEQGDDVSALRSLQRAGALKPSDLAVQEALRMIHDRNRPAAAPEPAPIAERDPWEAPEVLFEQPVVPPPPVPAPEPPPPTIVPTPTPAATPMQADAQLPADPTQLFDSLLKGGQVLGALILDQQGLVLAGSLSGETSSRAEALGAILGGAIEEAARTTQHLHLGEWKGILLEANEALLHLTPIREGMVVLVAAKRHTPAGWMLRAAHQASALASRFLEIYA